MNIELLKQLNEAYIEFFNDYISIETYADHHCLTIEQVKLIIAAGKAINHDQDLLNVLYK